MIGGSKAHLRANGETYVEHLRFAATVGSLAIGAGLACLIHALIPALCTTTASRTIRHLTALLGERGQLVETRAAASELLASCSSSRSAPRSSCRCGCCRWPISCASPTARSPWPSR